MGDGDLDSRQYGSRGIRDRSREGCGGDLGQQRVGGQTQPEGQEDRFMAHESFQQMCCCMDGTQCASNGSQYYS